MTDIAAIPTIETERLRLRAPEMRDFEEYAAFRASHRAKGVGGPYTRAEAFEQFAELIGHWTLRGYGRWIVAERDSDLAVGVVGLYYPVGWPEPELAWAMFSSGEGRGIAFEAAREAREFAYGTLGWTTAISCIMQDNPRSEALAARLGAVRDGNFTHPNLGILNIWRHPGPDHAPEHGGSADGE